MARVKDGNNVLLTGKDLEDYLKSRSPEPTPEPEPEPVSYKEMKWDDALKLAIEEHGEAFRYYYENDKEWFDKESDIDAMVEQYEEQYQGEFESLQDYASNLADELGMFEGLPQNSPLIMYFDAESYGRDLELGGDIWVHEESYKTVYIYSNH